MSLATFKFATSNIGVAFCAGYAIEMLAMENDVSPGITYSERSSLSALAWSPRTANVPVGDVKSSEPICASASSCRPAKRAGERPAGERQQRLVDRQA